MFSKSLPEKLAQKYTHLGAFKGSQSVSGGDINEAYLLEFEGETLFLKSNDSQAYPRMFELEAKGLNLLKQKTEFKIPPVLETGIDGSDAFLLLRFIDSGKRGKDFWWQFGTKLAAMHRESHPTFGLEYNNYMGKLPQSNASHQNWTDFFAEERILPQFRLARDQGYFDPGTAALVDRFLARLPDIIPEEEPALVHGDLWGGNYMVDTEGQPVLIDPAVYYGHREVDIAMMHLFGGFAADLFEVYHQEYPLERGWKKRLDYHNLYPVLIHVNLFGAGYASQAQSIIKRFA